MRPPKIKENWGAVSSSNKVGPEPPGTQFGSQPKKGTRRNCPGGPRQIKAVYRPRGRATQIPGLRKIPCPQMKEMGSLLGKARAKGNLFGSNGPQLEFPLFLKKLDPNPPVSQGKPLRPWPIPKIQCQKKALVCQSKLTIGIGIGNNLHRPKFKNSPLAFQGVPRKLMANPSRFLPQTL